MTSQAAVPVRPPSRASFKPVSFEVLGWIASYLLSGLLVSWLGDGDGPSLWYPPIAIGVALLMRGGLRLWPVLFVLDLVVSYPQYDGQFGDAVIVAGNTTIECLLAAWWLGGPAVSTAWSHNRDIALRLGLVALVATGMGAAIGALLLRVGGRSPHLMFDTWLTWWLGDATTLLTLLPALYLTFVRPSEPLPEGRRIGEGIALLAVTLAVGLSQVFTSSGLTKVVVSGLMLGTIPVLWAAVRYDLRTTAWVVALVSVTSIVGMRLHPDGLLALNAAFAPQVLVQQGNLVVLALAGFTLAPVLAGERRARAELQRLAGDLRMQVTHTRLAQRAGRTGSWECDPDGGNALWSDEFFVLCRIDPAGGVPPFERLLELAHPDSRRVLQEGRAAALEGRLHDTYHVQIRWPDGSAAWHAVRWEAVSLAGRRRIIGTHTDVTELMQRQLAAEHLAAIVSTATEAIFTVDDEYRIRTWNPSAERLFAWPAEAAHGQSMFDLVPASRKRFKERRLADAFGGRSAETPHAEMQTADGRLFHVRVSFTPVRDATGRIAEVAIVCSDLTRQRELEDQLLQAQKMEVVGRLAGGIAHDFNNMLTAILGFSELARAQVASDPVAGRSIDQVVEAAERAASLTQRLLAFSRRQPHAAQPLELDTELARILPLFRRMLGEDLELELIAGAPGALVMLDPTQFEQVVLNLVINARDAMPVGGQIVIETRRLAVGSQAGSDPAAPSGRCVQLSVRDTGVGMDRETRERIFEPFFTTKEPGRGTGLGLSTVFAIVRENLGVIRVQSALGEGTTFLIEFPEARPALVEPAATSPLHVAARGGEEHVLVVEDEPLVREFLAACLRAARYQVHLAASAEQALELLSDPQSRVDLLISDIVLPRMTGIELARIVHETRPELPVLFLSGYSEAMFEGGLPGNLLSKPFTRDDLLAAVRRDLEHDRARPGL